MKVDNFSIHLIHLGWQYFPSLIWTNTYSFFFYKYLFLSDFYFYKVIHLYETKLNFAYYVTVTNFRIFIDGIHYHHFSN